jgi:8-oxo-dGTP diphosphatase
MKRNVVAKTLLFNADGKALVLRRAPDDEHSPGRVDLPGGAVDPGEDCTAAAVREIEEEAGLAVHFEDMQLVYSFTVYVEAKDATVIRLLYLARTADTDVKLSFEHDAYSWQSPEDVLQSFAATPWNDALRFVFAHDMLAGAWKE